MLQLHFSPRSRRQMSHWTCESHAFSSLVASGKKSYDLFSDFSQHRSVCKNASKAVMLHGHFCLTAHLSRHPYPLSSCSFSPLRVHSSVIHLLTIYNRTFERIYYCSLSSHALCSARTVATAVPSIINHLWMRSLHHKSHLPRRASPFPSLSTHGSINSPPCSRK